MNVSEWQVSLADSVSKKDERRTGEVGSELGQATLDKTTAAAVHTVCSITAIKAHRPRFVECLCSGPLPSPPLSHAGLSLSAQQQALFTQLLSHGSALKATERPALTARLFPGPRRKLRSNRSAILTQDGKTRKP